MPLRPVKRLIKAKPAIEGAGVRNGPAVNRLPAFVRNVGQLEPATLRLTAELVVAASRCKHKYLHARKTDYRDNWGDPGGTQEIVGSTRRLSAVELPPGLRDFSRNHRRPTRPP